MKYKNILTPIEQSIVNKALEKEETIGFSPLVSKQECVSSPYGIGFIDGACWMNGCDNWIKTTDMLPDEGVEVLVITSNGKQRVVKMYIPRDCHGNVLREKEWKGSHLLKNSITHWKYLPCPPSK